MDFKEKVILVLVGALLGSAGGMGGGIFFDDDSGKIDKIEREETAQWNKINAIEIESLTENDLKLFLYEKGIMK